MRDKVTRQRPQTTTFEKKGEPKRIRTEVLLLTSLTPYRWAKPAHNEMSALVWVITNAVVGALQTNEDQSGPQSFRLIMEANFAYSYNAASPNRGTRFRPFIDTTSRPTPVQIQASRSVGTHIQM